MGNPQSEKYNQNIKDLTNLIRESKKVVVFTGAGMSTESGLQDYRGLKGVWKDKDPYEVAHIDAIDNNYEEFRNFYMSRMMDVQHRNPNEGHYILAEWVNNHTIEGIVTQNVDGLHLSAGLTPEDNDNIVELHGTLRESVCIKCGNTRSGYSLYSKCPDCKGKMRPNVVLFGENLSEEVALNAIRMMDGADLVLVLGSSLQVVPAFDLLMDALREGSKLAIVNQDPTPLDGFATIVINGDILVGSVLKSINHGLLSPE